MAKQSLAQYCFEHVTALSFTTYGLPLLKHMPKIHTQIGNPRTMYASNAA